MERLFNNKYKDHFDIIVIGGGITGVCMAYEAVTRGVETPLGGVSLDLTRHMNNILEINPTNSTATIQAGIYGPALEEQLNAAGFSCGHFPQSFEYSTPGGWLAAKGAGQASTGYGKFEHMVLALKGVTPAGTISTKCYPSSAQGWDIHPLFAGSEGTLGVVAELTIRIRKYMPENTAHASLLFKNFPSAVEAMRHSMQAGIGLPHLFRVSDPEETEIAFKTKGVDGNLTDKFLHALGYRTGTRFHQKDLEKTRRVVTGWQTNQEMAATAIFQCLYA